MIRRAEDCVRPVAGERRSISAAAGATILALCFRANPAIVGGLFCAYFAWWLSRRTDDPS